MAGKVKRAAKRAVTIVRQVAAPVPRVARRVARRVSAGAVRAYRSPVVRRAASAVGKQGTAMAIAQARILPGALGGYALAMVERGQRKAHAAMVASGEGGKTPTGGAIIKDPKLRLAAYLAALAFGASKTSGIAREMMIGAAGAVGYAYNDYATTDGSNPSDNYFGDIKDGRAGI